MIASTFEILGKIIILKRSQYSAFPAEAWRSDTHDLHVRSCITITITITITIIRCQASNVYGRVVSTLVHVRGVVEEALVIRSPPQPSSPLQCAVHCAPCENIVTHCTVPTVLDLSKLSRVFVRHACHNVLVLIIVVMPQ